MKRDFDLVARPLSDGAFEPLDDHLRAVARLASDFAARFDASKIGEAAGLLHDLGKAKPEWQDYLRRAMAGAVRAVPHSGEGARAAAEKVGGEVGRALAFAIAGHHAGLANGSARGALTPLEDRLVEAEALEPLLPIPQLPDGQGLSAALGASRHPSFGRAFFTRMLFSCLVDADRLASEQADGGGADRGWTGDLATLKARLDAHLARFGRSEGAVALARTEVLSACRDAARKSPGLFSLTVPTGGGKTLSSLAFALDHAARHGLERIVYVIPFTSIIEQTADVFREALGDADAVLEHHSGFDEDQLPSETETRDIALRLRLAAENWDRPVVVTTAVQFFESLFANRPSRCRKLHRLARAVVVLDEAQTLPLRIFRPCLAALDELARCYGSTAVLCTATQPATTDQAGLKAPEALVDVREIIPDPARLYRALKRVQVVRMPAPLEDDALADAMKQSHSALAIVNSRAHAQALFEALSAAAPDGAWHLSTAMTGAHRRAALARIRANLLAHRPTRVISTSLIEAGVDISFASVWRATAGLDSIAQAAGRCNRHGELGDGGGRVTVFEAAGWSEPRDLQQFAQVGRVTLEHHADPLSLEALAEYFRELILARGISQLDATVIGEAKTAGVMNALVQDAGRRSRWRTTPDRFRFADIGEAFRVIESAMVPIIVPDSVTSHGAPAKLLERLRHSPQLRGIMRELQPFTVQVPRFVRADLIRLGLAFDLRSDTNPGRYFVLSEGAPYRADVGLDWRDPTNLSPATLIF